MCRMVQISCKIWTTLQSNTRLHCTTSTTGDATHADMLMVLLVNFIDKQTGDHILDVCLFISCFNYFHIQFQLMLMLILLPPCLLRFPVVSCMLLTTPWPRSRLRPVAPVSQRVSTPRSLSLGLGPAPPLLSHQALSCTPSRTPCHRSH